jgi:hypothetical protein
MMLFCIIFIFATARINATGSTAQQIIDFNDKNFKNVGFYHILASGFHYESIVDSQLRFINRTDIKDVLDTIFYVAVGADNASFVINDAKFQRIEVEAPVGNEEDTLGALHRFCQTHPTSNVLFFHNKGSEEYYYSNLLTREALDCFVLNRNCLRTLNDHDVCGMRASPYPFIHYSGNFWWARCSYVKTLISPLSAHRNATFIEVSKQLSKCSGHDTRLFAKQWIGTAPTVKVADCIPAMVDSTYLYGNHIDQNLLTMCPSLRSGATSFGHACQTASTFTDAPHFQTAFQLATKQEGGCRDRSKDIELRTRLWYGQNASTYIEWMERFDDPSKLKDNIAVRPSNSKQVYYYTEGQMRAIPNIDVFNSLHLDFDHVTVLVPEEMQRYPVGPDMR